MPDLTTAVEIAAKALHDALHDRSREYLSVTPEWDNLTQSEVYRYKEAVLPALTALAEAGLLKGDQS